jgi:hypothetical protein
MKTADFYFAHIGFVEISEWHQNRTKSHVMKEAQDTKKLKGLKVMQVH